MPVRSPYLGSWPVPQTYLVLNDIRYHGLLIIVRRGVEIGKKNHSLFLTYLSTNNLIIVEIYHNSFSCSARKGASLWGLWIEYEIYAD